MLEARNESGGRLYSRNFAGHKIEVGANWVCIIYPVVQ